jgi:hypothetical protein
VIVAMLAFGEAAGQPSMVRNRGCMPLNQMLKVSLHRCWSSRTIADYIPE